LLELSNRQRKKRVDLTEFRVFAEEAIARVTDLVKPTPLPEEVSVAFVTDRRIAEIHHEYMLVDGPTDVITFQYGEIVISVETAERQAEQFSTSFARELRLYFVHGLLHLAGWDDLTSNGFRKMADTQERIVGEVELALTRASAARAPVRAPEDE
jgi:probable rRNA maturation factor